MKLTDPTSTSDDSSLHPLAARIDSLPGNTIGLYDNGKMAAEPVLQVYREKLQDRHDALEVRELHFSHKQKITDAEGVERVKAWAEEIDACIGAIGDCGSCTKFLTWGMIALEEEGVPTVGLVDEGFVLDYQTNALERGMPLRYNDQAVRSEIRDHEKIATRLTPEVMSDIESELTRPLTEKERGPVATH